jgi:type IV fimbrial biogenesis protein FimT
MITVAIMGIMMTVGLPSFQSIILGARLTSASNAMISALQLAGSASGGDFYLNKKT